MRGHLPFSMAPPLDCRPVPPESSLQFFQAAYCSELPVPSRDSWEGLGITLLPELVR